MRKRRIRWPGRGLSWPWAPFRLFCEVLVLDWRSLDVENKGGLGDIQFETVSARLVITDTNVSEGCVGPIATTPLRRSAYCAPKSVTTSPPIEWPTTTAWSIANLSITAITSSAMDPMDMGWPVYSERPDPYVSTVMQRCLEVK